MRFWASGKKSSARVFAVEACGLDAVADGASRHPSAIAKSKNVFSLAAFMHLFYAAIAPEATAADPGPQAAR